MYRSIISIFVVGFGIMLVGFQNCGEGFAPLSTTNKSLGNGGGDGTGGGDGNDDGGGTTPSLTKRNFEGYSFEQFSECREALPDGMTGIVNCLNNKSGDVGNLTQGMATTCIQNSASESEYNTNFFIANCLAKNGAAPKGYRDVNPLDVAECANATNDFNCLDNKGVLPISSNTQGIFNNCVNNPSVGIENLRACFRKQGLLVAPAFLTQGEAYRCELIFGAENVSDCLKGKGVVDATLTQAMVDGCGNTPAARCIREAGQTSTVLMQPHVDQCKVEVGSDNIGNCLVVNGLSGNIADATFVSEIQACQMAVNDDSLSRCIHKVDNNLEKSSMPLTAHFQFCEAMVGLDGVKMGNCLDKSGLLPPGVPLVETQQALNTCFGNNVGSDAVVNCLKRAQPNAVILDHDSMVANGTGFFSVNNCLNCHAGANPRAGLDWSDYNMVIARVSNAGLPVVTPFDLNQSQAFQRVSNAANPMPPLGNSPFDANRQIEMRRWILQGAKQSYE